MSDVPYRYARTKKLLGQILKEMGVIHEGMVQEALPSSATRAVRSVRSWSASGT